MQFGGFLDDLIGQTQTRLQEILGQKIEKGLDKLAGNNTTRSSVGVVMPDVPSEVARAQNNVMNNGILASKIAGVPLWAALGALAIGTYFLVRKK